MLYDLYPVCLESRDLPMDFQDPTIATVILRAVSDIQNEMPALVFGWNHEGFNDVSAIPNYRNGVAGQTKRALIAIIEANGGKNWNDTVFTFYKWYENWDMGEGYS